MDESLIKINVNVGGRMISLTIKREYEERFRKSAKIINECVADLQKRFAAHNDNMDFVAVVALNKVVELLELEERKDIDSFLNEVDKINDDLSNI